MYRMVRPQDMKFYYVYVLQSFIKDFIYVGYTTDLNRNIKDAKIAATGKIYSLLN